MERVKETFEECTSIIKLALNNLSLPFERDSAKSAPLVSEVKMIASNGNINRNK